MGALLWGLLVGCAPQATPRASPAASQPPRPPYGQSYECAPQTKLSKPPSDSEILLLERRCAPGQLKDSGSKVTDCPCTELGLALSERPGPQERARGMKILMKDCSLGSLLACDSYELERELCLRDPEQPSCSPIREAGLIPEEKLPLRDVLDCRRHERRVVCLDEQRYFVRDAGGQWDQARIESWHREDVSREARWVAELPGGARVIVTRGYLKSDSEKIPSGRSVKLTPAELASARRAIQAQPKVERRCHVAYQCLEAIANRRPRAVPRSEGQVEGEELEVERPEAEVPFADLLTSLRGCERARTLALASLDGQPPPSACMVK